MPESTLSVVPSRDGTQIAPARSAAGVLALVVALVLPVAAFGTDGPTLASGERTGVGAAGPRAPERGPFGPDLVGQLVRLNDRLGLDSFPEDSPRWAERLVAAIEHRTGGVAGISVAAEAVPGRELLRHLTAEIKGLLAGEALAGGTNGAAEPSGRSRAESLRRILETVRLLHDELDRLDQEQSRRQTIRALVVPTRGISGRVTRQDTGASVAGAGVEIYDLYGYYLTSVLTGADGTYAVDGLAEGDYYVKVLKAGLISELYNDVSCPFWLVCYPSSSGNPVHVGASGLTTGIDFALAQAGGVSGTVTEVATGQGISSYVRLFSATGAHLETYVAAADGTYQIDSLPSGTYFLVAEQGGYLAEVYDDIPCPGTCDPTIGTGVAVVGGTTVTGIDFTLDRLGTITGTVTDAGTGAPLSGQGVTVYDDLGYPGFPVFTLSDGSYESAGLASGTYFVRTDTSDYQDVLFDGFACEPSCDATTGTPVGVTVATKTSGVDFSLAPLGAIAGTVLEAGSGTPVTDQRVVAFDSAGNPASSAFTISDGSYEIRHLLPGTYTVKTATDTHQNELWNDVFCDPTCDVSTGDPITVSSGSTTAGIDFSLAWRGKITGTVTEAVGGLAVAFASLHLHGSDGGWLGSFYSATDGTYESPPLPDGSYYLVVAPSSFTYVGQIYDGLACTDSCSVTSSGNPVAVVHETTTSGIDFALDRFGVIRGAVTAADTGNGLEGSVVVLDQTGAFVRSDYTGVGGVFMIGSVPPGTYYVRTVLDAYGGASQYQDEVFDGVGCEPTCDLGLGTPISVTPNSTVAGVDFLLAPCPAETNVELVNTLVFGSQVEQACESLTAGSNTVVSAAGTVTFKAGRKIVLTDGFSVEPGASFRAVIEPAWASN